MELLTEGDTGPLYGPAVPCDPQHLSVCSRDPFESPLQDFLGLSGEGALSKGISLGKPFEGSDCAE